MSGADDTGAAPFNVPVVVAIMANASAHQNNTDTKYMICRIGKAKVFKALCVHRITADAPTRNRTGFKRELEEPEQVPTKTMRIEAYETYREPKLWKGLVNFPSGTIRQWVKRHLEIESLKRERDVFGKTISHGEEGGNQNLTRLFSVNLDFATKLIKISSEDASFAEPACGMEGADLLASECGTKGWWSQQLANWNRGPDTL